MHRFENILEFVLVHLLHPSQANWRGQIVLLLKSNGAQTNATTKWHAFHREYWFCMSIWTHDDGSIKSIGPADSTLIYTIPSRTIVLECSDYCCCCCCINELQQASRVPEYQINSNLYDRKTINFCQLSKTNRPNIARARVCIGDLHQEPNQKANTNTHKKECIHQRCRILGTHKLATFGGGRQGPG